MRRLLVITATAGLAAAAVPAAAYAATGSAASCQTVHDVIMKTDDGHGTPPEWANLVMRRATKVCGDEKAGYTVTLTDVGRLWTITGAGTPNGTGGQITHRVPGRAHGTYSLTVTGGTPAHRHGNTSLSSTDYVKSLFSEGATVTGGAYSWTYVTVCGEKWVDSSANNDGQGDAAGNITGKLCHKPKPTPTPTPTATDTPSPTPTSTTPAGEAPSPTPVKTNLPVTG